MLDGGVNNGWYGVNNTLEKYVSLYPYFRPRFGCPLVSFSDGWRFLGFRLS
jgi:hypothetical protein